ncbi:MAG: acylneuraminate cytidylyltransferase [Bacteroidota bacterium]|nr:acylneuraminate cytidylyltransferase [Bacteroidota bacterium]
MTKNKIIAFMPVRGGSKSIPLKNIKLFCGHPLLYWNLQELSATNEIDEIIVATESSEIEAIVKEFNFAKVSLYRRAKENATDKASTESVILEYLATKDELPDDTLFMLVQATSPLTTRIHFSEGLEKIGSKNVDSVVSCSRLKKFLWSENGQPLNYDVNFRPMRQDFKGELVENGAFYISTIKKIRESKCRLSGKIVPFEMPGYCYVEIDEEEDWLIAEKLMYKYFPYFPENSNDRLKQIKLVATDVDGVLTDAGMYYTEAGDEIKKFNTRDGKGFELLRNQHIKTAMITSENTQIVKRRGEKLRADYVIQGVSGIQKLEELKRICQIENISLKNCAYIGDDINCVPILENVGAAFCPMDAEKNVKLVPGITILNSIGGGGAFREVASIILEHHHGI